jgi:hypothetical protein
MFATKSEDAFSFDVTGLVLSVIAAAAVTYMTAGGGGLVEDSLRKIEGSWWKDLARTYVDTADQILRNATKAMGHLNEEMAQLAQNFKDSVPGFADALPQLDQAPNR